MFTRTLSVALLLLTASSLLSGCILFSPYASPVVKPMKQGDVEVQAGGGALPLFYGEGKMDLGLEGGIRFSPVDRLMLGGRLWSSTDAWEENDIRIDGFGFDASLLLADPERTNILHLAPAIHLQYGSRITVTSPPTGQGDSETTLASGYGYGVGLNLWTPTSSSLHPFAATSIRRHTFSVDNGDENNVLTFNLHGGLGYELTDNFNVAAEIVYVYEYPEDADTRESLTSSFFLAPMIRGAWRF